jgi:hypothetical protein
VAAPQHTRNRYRWIASELRQQLFLTPARHIGRVEGLCIKEGDSHFSESSATREDAMGGLPLGANEERAVNLIRQQGTLVVLEGCT